MRKALVIDREHQDVRPQVGLELGVNDFLTKPFSLNALLAAVEQRLGD